MDKRILRELVETVLTVCREDDTGVTIDLVDIALRAGAEIGLSKRFMNELLGEAFTNKDE